MLVQYKADMIIISLECDKKKLVLVIQYTQNETTITTVNSLFHEEYICYVNKICLFHRELSRFIAAGRLHCKIDKVKGIVETNRPDSKNWQYQVKYSIVQFLSQIQLMLMTKIRRSIQVGSCCVEIKIVIFFGHYGNIQIDEKCDREIDLFWGFITSKYMETIHISEF